MKKVTKKIMAIAALAVMSASLTGCTAEIKITPTEDWEKELIQSILNGDSNIKLPDSVTIHPDVVLDGITTTPPATEPPTPTTPPTTEPPAPTTPPATQEPQMQTVKYLKSKADRLNVRSGAGTGYSVLGQIVEGEYLPYYGETGNWYETRFLGKKAYVSKDYLIPVSFETEENEEIESVLAVGYSLLGTPYVFGATRVHDGGGNLLSGFTTKEFDCSSFTQYIFYKGAGKIIATTTRTQVLQGKPVKTEDLKRGDLLFMTNDSRVNNTGIERIGHVAVYLGNNMILHTSSDYAKIVEMTQKKWEYTIEIRRFL